MSEVSGANDPATASEPTAATEPHGHEPLIQVVKGEPTEQELAALVAVLAGSSSPPPEPREQELNLWGHPVNQLRYTTFSWQRVTLLERTHMRR